MDYLWDQLKRLALLAAILGGVSALGMLGHWLRG